MKNLYVIMGEEDYGKAISEAAFDDNFPVNPPCAFPMLMIKIESMDPIPHPGPGNSTLYQVHRSWIGIPAEALSAILFPTVKVWPSTNVGKPEIKDVGLKSQAETAHLLVQDIMFAIRFGEPYKHMTHSERMECERAAATLEKWLMAAKGPPKPEKQLPTSEEAD